MAFDWENWIFNQAVHYLARHAASEQHVSEILTRKVIRKLHRKDGLEGFPDYAGGLPLDLELKVKAAVQRCVELGYISDSVYGQMRIRTLRAKGWPSKRISYDLIQKGLSQDLVQKLLDEEDNQHQQDFLAAVSLAKRRGFGPFQRRSGRAQAKPREKQIQALQRAGHSYTIAAKIIDAEDESELLESES